MAKKATHFVHHVCGPQECDCEPLCHPWACEAATTTNVALVTCKNCLRMTPVIAGRTLLGLEDKPAPVAAARPSWADAPEWAKWLAQDQDGAWYWYEHKPKVMHARFEIDYSVEGREKSRAARAKHYPNWEGTLESRQ